MATAKDHCIGASTLMNVDVCQCQCECMSVRTCNPAAIPVTIILDWLESMMVAAWQYRIKGD